MAGEKAQRSLEAIVGEQIQKEYGGDLFRYCHFEKEPSILQLLLKVLCSMEIDLSPLLGGAPIYDSSKHIAKLGLHTTLPGLILNTDSNKPDKFMRAFAWKTQLGANVMSEGFGVNMWSLLLFGSLAGSNEIHCKQSARVANSILSLILRLAPSGATPGNMMPVRGINERSQHPECVQVSSKGRCEHFIRPINDDNFAMNGRFSYCDMNGDKMPEDYLGLGYVLEMSKFLKCKYECVPPQYIQGHIQLMQDRFYCIYKHSEGGQEGIYGTLLIDKHGAHVVYDGDKAATWTYEEWQTKLGEIGYLVLPTVARSGALVTYDDGGNVGCLVPSGTRASMISAGIQVPEGGYVPNFDNYRVCYTALVEENTLLPMPPLLAIDNLVPPGTVLWIKPDTQAWADLSPSFPPTSLSEEEAGQRMVKVRLNVPQKMVSFFLVCASAGESLTRGAPAQHPTPGVVYVTVRQRSVIHSRDIHYKHIEVDPWELTLVEPAEALRIDAICL